MFLAILFIFSLFEAMRRSFPQFRDIRKLSKDKKIDLFKSLGISENFIDERNYFHGYCAKSTMSQTNSKDLLFYAIRYEISNENVKKEFYFRLQLVKSVYFQLFDAEEVFCFIDVAHNYFILKSKFRGRENIEKLTNFNLKEFRDGLLRIAELMRIADHQQAVFTSILGLDSLFSSINGIMFSIKSFEMIVQRENTYYDTHISLLSTLNNPPPADSLFIDNHGRTFDIIIAKRVRHIRTFFSFLLYYIWIQIEYVKVKQQIDLIESFQLKIKHLFDIKQFANKEFFYWSVLIEFIQNFGQEGKLARFIEENKK